MGAISVPRIFSRYNSTKSEIDVSGISVQIRSPHRCLSTGDVEACRSSPWHAAEENGACLHISHASLSYVSSTVWFRRNLGSSRLLGATVCFGGARPCDRAVYFSRLRWLLHVSSIVIQGPCRSRFSLSRHEPSDRPSHCTVCTSQENTEAEVRHGVVFLHAICCHFQGLAVSEFHLVQVLAKIPWRPQL